MCQLNGELIVFGGSDQTPGTPNSQPISKEVDAFVYHMRPRLRRTRLGPSQCSGFGGGGGGGGDVDCSTSSLASLLERSPSSSPTQTAAVRHNPALLRLHETAMAEEVVAHMGLIEAAQARRAEAARAAAGGDASLTGVAATRFAAEPRAASAARAAAASSRERRQVSAIYPSTHQGEATYSECVRAVKGMPQRPYGVKVRPGFYDGALQSEASLSQRS